MTRPTRADVRIARRRTRGDRLSPLLPGGSPVSTIRQHTLTVSPDLEPDVLSAFEELISSLRRSFDDTEKRIGQLDARSGQALMARDIVSARLSHSTTQSINDVTWTILAFDTEDYDFGNLHQSAANTRITIRQDGRGPYSIGAFLQFATNATGLRRAHVKKNGTIATGSQAAAAALTGNITSLVLGWRELLKPGDYLEIQAHQSSGGALNVTSAIFWAERIRTIG